MIAQPKPATLFQVQENLLPGGGFLLEAAASREIFTSERFSEDQRAFYKTAIDFVEKEIVPLHGKIEEKEAGLTQALLRKAGELGLHMIDIPEQFGGLGLDKTTSVLVSEALARQGSFSVSLGAHNGIGMLPLVFYGSEALKEEWLPKFADASVIGAYALTEPGSGSDALAAKTTAVLSDDGEHWVLNGSKMWITNAAIADVFTVFAKIDGKRFSAFLVPANLPGLSIGAEEPKMGIRGSSTCAMAFDNVKIPRGNLLGEEGKGHKIAFNILNMGRLRLGVAVMGGAKKVLNLATTYAKDRKQFGQTLSSFPIIQQKLADMAVRIYITESTSYRTTGAIDAAMTRVAKDDPERVNRLVEAIEEYNIEASIMKVSGSEALDFIVDEAVQIHGGYGYSEEYAVECAYRDSRINRIFEGTNEINRMLIPGTILKRAMKGHLNILPVTQEIQTSLQHSHSPVPPLGDGPLAEEVQLAELVRKATIYTIGTAAMKLMTELEKEQEQLEMLADMCIDTYNIDTVVRRAVQAQTEASPKAARIHALFAQIASREIYEQAMARARRIVVELFPDVDQYTRFMELKRLHIDVTAPVIPLKREIAQAVIEADGYPLGHLR